MANKHIKSEQKQRAMFRSSTYFSPLMWALAQQEITVA